MSGVIQVKTARVTSADNLFTMTTALSPAQCVDRLAQAIDHAPFSVFVNRPFRGMQPESVVGEIDGSAFSLRRRLLGVNSFQTIATAVIEPTADGSRIVGHFSVCPVGRKIAFVWLWSTILIGGPVLFELAHGLLSGVIRWEDLLDPSYRPELVALIFFAGFGAGYLMSRGASAGDDEFLRTFLRRTLDAHGA